MESTDRSALNEPIFEANIFRLPKFRRLKVREIVSTILLLLSKSQTGRFRDSGRSCLENRMHVGQRFQLESKLLENISKDTKLLHFFWLAMNCAILELYLNLHADVLIIICWWLVGLCVDDRVGDGAAVRNVARITMNSHASPG
jgi:hypothetical protein